MAGRQKGKDEEQAAAECTQPTCHDVGFHYDESARSPSRFCVLRSVFLQLPERGYHGQPCRPPGREQPAKQPHPDRIKQRLSQ